MIFQEDSKLKRLLRQVDKEIDQLNLEFDKVSNERDHLLKEVRRLTECNSEKPDIQLNILRNNLDTIRNERDFYHSHVLDLQVLLQEFRAEVDSLREHNKLLESDLRTLKVSLLAYQEPMKDTKITD